MRDSIDVKNLSVSYGTLKAVDDISFSVNDGEIFGIIGENGAGKTTTVECIAGIKTNYSGTINVLGEDITKAKRSFYNRLSIQPQEASFPEKLKVWEIMKLFSSLYNSPLPYHDLLEKLDVADKVNSYYGNLSGGQKQKISIIAALISNAEVLILDELTTGLDPQSRLKTLNAIKEYSSGRTVIMTTHYLNEIEQLCNRVCILKKGKIVGIGALKELYKENGIEYKVSVTTHDNKAKTLMEAEFPNCFLLASGVQISLFGNDPNMKNQLESIFLNNGISYSSIENQYTNADDLYFKLFDEHCDSL